MAKEPEHAKNASSARKVFQRSAFVLRQTGISAPSILQGLLATVPELVLLRRYRGFGTKWRTPGQFHWRAATFFRGCLLFDRRLTAVGQVARGGHVPIALDRYSDAAHDFIFLTVFSRAFPQVCWPLLMLGGGVFYFRISSRGDYQL